MKQGMITEDVLKKLLISFFAVAVFVGAALVTVVIMSSCVEADNPFLEVTKIIPREVPEPPPPPPPEGPDPEVPRITEHPKGALYTVQVASAALIVSAEVDDGGTLSCQWYRASENSNEKGTKLDGATQWWYTPPTVSLGIVYYYAVITNTLNERTAEAASDTARIEIIDGVVTVIEIAAQPTQLTYTHGDALDLDGLALAITYNNSTTETVAYADFTSRNISVSLINGVTLSRVAHNGTTVSVHFVGFTAETAALVVNKAVPEITFPTVDAVTYDPARSLSALVLLGGSFEAGDFRWANNLIVPVVNQNGYDVQFTPYDTDNYDYSSLTGWNGSIITRRVPITVYPAIISNAVVRVVGPATSEEPSAWAAGSSNVYMFNGSTAWSPNDSRFQGEKAYKATVTLWADENYLFEEQMTGTINNNPAEVSGPEVPGWTGRQVTLTYTFAPTDIRIVTDFTLLSPPTRNLTYTHNERLNLTGLEVQFTYNDGSYDTVRPAQFLSRNITADPFDNTLDPANNKQLSCVDHNGYPLTVSYGGITLNVGTLTVNKLAGAAIANPPTIASIGANSITINAATLSGSTGQVIEYAASTTANENAANLDWTAGKLNFGGLVANMTYYVYARSQESATYYAGAMRFVSASLQSYMVNMEQITDGSNLNLTFTVNGVTTDKITLSRTRGPTTAIVSIPSLPTGYNSIAWLCDGVPVSGVSSDGLRLTLNVTNALYGWPGRHYITVILSGQNASYPPISRRFEVVTND
jgi:hypothetical protein